MLKIFIREVIEPLKDEFSTPKGENGFEQVERFYRKNRSLLPLSRLYGTEIIVASVRSPQHVLQAGMMGADICTIPCSVMLQLTKHPLTDIGLEKFLADWKKHVDS